MPDPAAASSPLGSPVAEANSSLPPAENPLQGYFESLIVTVILALFATTFLTQAFKIPSSSMVPALLVGDHLLVNKFVYAGDGMWYDRFLPFRAIRRGDVIVFKYPYEDHPYYVKRVIAVPGDRVHIADQRVYLNGSVLKEPYAIHDPSSADPYMFNFPPEDPFIISGEVTPEWARILRDDTHDGDLYVPAGEYFVLGDNRDHSSDSRYWGFVPRDAIVGQPMFVYWSLKAPASESEASSVSQAFANLGRTLLDIPFRTRWNRTFHEVH
jgi:signal peptidase I